MSESELARIKGDLTIMQRAMRLHLSYGKGMLALGIVMTTVAIGSAVFSLLVEDDRVQLAPLTAILVIGSVGMYLRSRRNANISPQIITQVLVSITIYAVVWVAACGYVLAAVLGPTIGTARTAGLHSSSIALLLVFSAMLVRSALRSREHHYCLGLAVSTLLTGMVLPVLNPHYTYPLTHCFMAAGYLTVVVIQWIQLRDAAVNHATD